MRILAFVAVCLVASVAMGSVTYTPSIDVSLVPADQTVTVGSEFTLSIHLKAIQPIVNDNDFHAQILLAFDPSKLELLGAAAPASIVSFDLFGTMVPEYIWHAPGEVTLNVGDELTLPAMTFRALAPVESTFVEIDGPFFNTPGHEGVKHNCDIDYVNSYTGAAVSVAPVPEPMTMVAAFMGLSGLGFYVRNRIGRRK